MTDWPDDDEPPMPAECDWGHCNAPAVAWRVDERLGELRVCVTHREAACHACGRRWVTLRVDGTLVAHLLDSVGPLVECPGSGRVGGVVPADRFADRSPVGALRVHTTAVPWRPTDPAPLSPDYLAAVARYLDADHDTVEQQRGPS